MVGDVVRRSSWSPLTLRSIGEGAQCGAANTGTAPFPPTRGLTTRKLERQPTPSPKIPSHDIHRLAVLLLADVVRHGSKDIWPEAETDRQLSEGAGWEGAGTDSDDVAGPHSRQEDQRPRRVDMIAARCRRHAA